MITTMHARICKPSEPHPDPVSQIEFGMIEVGDIVRYQTTQTGHRCGVVVSRKDITAPLVVTVGVGCANRRKVSVVRAQLLEWRPTIQSKVA